MGIFLMTISALSIFFVLLTFFGLVVIFDRVTALGSLTIKGFSITILGVLIIPLVALSLKLFFKDFSALLDTLFGDFLSY